MFRRLGDILSKWWFVVLGLWLAAFIALRVTSPSFNDLARGGEFVFLPSYMASRHAETLFDQTFPGRLTTSSMVVVVYREDKNGLSDADRTFITDKLTPALQELRDHLNALEASRTGASHDEDEKKFVTSIHDFTDRGIGALLVSNDQKASLVTMELGLDFQDTRNWEAVQNVERTLGTFERSPDKPDGLQLKLTGSAVLGRDLTKAEADSARNTGTLTICLVVVLLAVIYRAPLLALIPLLTLFMAVDVSLHLLALLARGGYVPIFKGLQEYTTVITYGPGIDYCLFLIARYKENLKECKPPKEALAMAIGQVGPAIAASAATVICGIGMLTFAQFGKFHEAGMSISIALVITLIATLSLTPSLLFSVGHWAFWPMSGFRCDENIPDGAKSDAVQGNLFQPLWTYMGGVIGRHPVGLLLTTVACMLPFAVVGIMNYGNVNYGLLESLPKTVASAEGARVLERHFAAGVTGPIQVLIQNPKLDFSDQEGISAVRNLVEKLMKRHEELKIADIRSVAGPLGMTQKANENSEESGISKAVEKKAELKKSIERYVSSALRVDGHATEVDVILTTNPFSMESIVALEHLMGAVYRELPKDQTADTVISFVGPTASVRDVNIVSHSDQLRIYLLVVSCVLVILVVLLRSVSVSLYLMVTVLFSYVATLGMTWLLFYCLEPNGFVGLDWTVPLFLFVVLIAVGEDYNIFLVTRIHEEQARSGPKQGIINALGRTGGIITSCGFIMAGTFATLSANSLVRMQQLGFALALGVMLDTFIIRPILVPAFLMVLNDDRYGKLIRYLK